MAFKIGWKNKQIRRESHIMKRRKQREQRRGKKRGGYRRENRDRQCHGEIKEKKIKQDKVRSCLIQIEIIYRQRGGERWHGEWLRVRAREREKREERERERERDKQTKYDTNNWLITLSQNGNLL